MPRRPTILAVPVGRASQPAFRWRPGKAALHDGFSGRLLALLLAFAFWPAMLRADDARRAAELADRYVDDFAARWRAEFETRFDEAETQDAATGQGSPLVDLRTVEDAQLRGTLDNMLRENYAKLPASLARAADEATADEAKLVARWKQVRQELNRRRVEVAQARTGSGVVEQLLSWVGFSGGLLVTAMLVAAAGLAYIRVHSERQNLRRHKGGNESAFAIRLLRALQVLAAASAAATLLLFFFEDSLRSAVRSTGLTGSGDPLKPIRDEVQAVQGELAQWQGRLEKARAQAEPSAAASQVRMKEALPGWGDEAHRQWREVREHIGRIAVSRRVQARVADSLEADAAQTAVLGRDLAGAWRQAAWSRRVEYWLRGSLGVLAVGVAVGLGGVWVRGVGRRQSEVRKTCPKCLRVGMLKYDRAARLARCTYSFGPGHDCGFAFAPKYIDLEKLCLPVLGTAHSGKSHWLAMTYRQLSEGTHPKQVSFFGIDSPAAKEFERMVRDILQQRLGTDPTPPGRIHSPLVFDFADCDPWGRSNILINVFDFPGEVVQRESMASPSRERALRGDGFFYFLDPVEPRETQAPALDRFISDLRLVQDAHKGRPVVTPIAVCVSKIDLMVTQPYAGRDGAAVREFYADLARIGWDLDLEKIELRSRRTAALCETIWHGWNLKQKLQGIPHQFFPLTPVGLDRPGSTDLSHIMIRPLGLLAPMMWLLHSNGYRVFR